MVKQLLAMGFYLPVHSADMPRHSNRFTSPSSVSATGLQLMHLVLLSVCRQFRSLPDRLFRDYQKNQEDKLDTLLLTCGSDLLPNMYFCDVFRYFVTPAA